MNLSLFIVGITSSINILLLLIIIKNSKETSKKAVSVFGASVIFLLAWSLCNYLADSATLVTTALTYTRLAFPSALLMGGEGYCFFLTSFRAVQYQDQCMVFMFF